jgi:hypothetical protein
MLTPDDEVDAQGDPLAFVVRWNILVSALIVEPSIKLIARTACDYAVRDGERVYPGNERLARETGYNSETVRHAWKALRALGMAERTGQSEWDGKKRTADEYDLKIPASWARIPVYGPKHGRFHCQHCGKAFNPRPGTHVRADGTVSWFLIRMVFCPDPGTPKRKPGGKRPPKPAGCFEMWDADRKRRGKPTWGVLKAEAWDLFYAARGDEWP